MKIPINEIICGDAFTELKKLPDECINCVITSPPYFNLRNYQNQDIVFGGDEKCEHIWKENITAGKYWGEPNKNVAGIFKNQSENTSYFGETINEHYATYPQDLIMPLIRAGCPEKGIILDMFNGSGTTCVAAKLFNRNYIGIDLSKKYCEIAQSRLNAIQNNLF